MECECVYVDKLHCTLNGVCDYTSSCVLYRSCPRPPDLLPPSTPSSPPFCFPPPLPWCLLGNHVVTLPDSSLLKSAVDKNSPRPVMWKRFARHTAYISAPPLPHYHQQILTFSHPSEALRCSLLPLTCEGRRRRLSPGRTRIFFRQSARTLPRLNPTTSERFGQLLFVSLSCTPHVM